jgi:hypothetical protein
MQISNAGGSTTRWARNGRELLLSDQNRAGCTRPRHHGGILRRHGDAMERAVRFSLGEQGIGRFGLHLGALGAKLHDGVQVRIHSGDPREIGFHGLLCRHLLLADALGEAGCREIDQLARTIERHEFLPKFGFIEVYTKATASPLDPLTLAPRPNPEHSPSGK